MAIHAMTLKPLQNILSTARIIKRSTDMPKSEEDEYTSNIISQTDRMFNIIKKLLDHNAIDQGEMRIKYSVFDVNTLCNELSSNLRKPKGKRYI